MSRQYDHYERTTRRAPARRSTLGYWVPLVLTVTVATIGLAAWIWSERDEEDEGYPNEGSNRWRGNDGGRPGEPPVYGDLRQGESAYGTTMPRPEENPNIVARMSGALRRTPSPQQFFDGASRAVGAGVAAAGAAVGSALSSIREEDKHAYRDHKTWSEEAESRRPGASKPSNLPDSPTQSQKTPFTGKKRTVAMVVSADVNLDGVMDEDDIINESILSYLPSKTDFARARLFVLIYAPGLKEHPDTASSRMPGSLSSSFSNIGHDDAEKPLTTSVASPAFNMLWTEAHSLVEKDTMVIPFSTMTGYEHLLRQLAPDIVYLQGSLAGKNGESIPHLQSWLRQDIVLVVGGEGGSGGLVDSESEAETTEKKTEQWWEREDRVGRGRGIVVVDTIRVGDDWAHRILGS